MNINLLVVFEPLIIFILVESSILPTDKMHFEPYQRIFNQILVDFSKKLPLLGLKLMSWLLFDWLQWSLTLTNYLQIGFLRNWDSLVNRVILKKKCLFNACDYVHTIFIFVASHFNYNEDPTFAYCGTYIPFRQCCQAIANLL